MRIGIDVRTSDVKKLVGRLKRLRSTTEVEVGGTYRQDPAWSQVFVETSKTLEEFDEWLWKRTPAEYAGIWEVV